MLDGNGIVGAGYLPPGYPQFFWKPSSSEALDYDPARAKQMLDDAGYKMGSNGVRVAPDGKPLEFRLGIHSDDATDAAIAPYLKEWMSAIGIKLDVNAMSFDQLNNNLAKGDWDMLMDGWSTGPDPTYLLSIQTCGTLPADDGTNGNTDSFFCNKKYDKLYEQQQTQFDAQERAATIAKMQEHPVRRQRRPDPVLQERADGDAHRPGDRLPAGREAVRRVLPAAARLHQLVEGAAGRGCRRRPASRRSEQSSNAFKWIGLAVLVVVVIGAGSCS